MSNTDRSRNVNIRYSSDAFLEKTAFSMSLTLSR